MLEKLKKLNPNTPFYSVNDDEFKPYGSVVSGYDLDEIITEAEKINMPESGSSYELSIPQFEKCGVYEKLKNEAFGETDIQVGFCWGYNDMLNGLEYHKSSEINVAATPMVLLLGLVTDIENDEHDSKNIKAFYLEKGEMVEVYATTLHFCPCQVSEKGFRSVVILPKGTNAPLDKPSTDKMLFKKNKWLLCHNNNEALIQRGVYSGIFGENFKITGV